MVRELTRTALHLIVILLVLTIYTKIAGSLPFSINSTTNTSIFDVTGEGKVTVALDLANVSAGVSVTGPSVKEVQDKMNVVINKVSAAVKDLGIDSKDIETSNYNVNPIYGESQRITGYSASTNLTVKVREINKVNSVIDSATEAGATNVSSLGFETSETEVFEEKARKEAIDNAKKKAEAAAKAAGFRLGRIINYQENPGGFPQPLAYEAGGRGGDLKTSLEPGSNEVIVTVTLSYEIK